MTAQRLIVALPIANIDGELVPMEPVQCESIEKARVMVDKLMRTSAGAIAWWREADPTTGDYGPPHIIAKRGKVPADLE
jgi:hypothetical protein